MLLARGPRAAGKSISPSRTHRVQDRTWQITEPERDGDVAQWLGVPLHDVDAFVAKRGADRADALAGSPQHQEHGPGCGRLDA